MSTTIKQVAATAARVRIERTIGAFAVLIVFACTNKSGDAHSPGHSTHSWKPAVLTVSRGVTAADIDSAISARVKGAPPPPVTTDTWQHVKKMYARFNSNPLWLSQDGFDRTRVSALLRSVASADSDALDMTKYPLSPLSDAVEAVQHNAHPTAQQLANADVLLTTAYMALAEGLLTGQQAPASLGQSWHIDPRDEHVDSALDASLRSDPLADAIDRMRPQDTAYSTLRAELQHYRQIVTAGGWQPVPDGPMLHPGSTTTPARLSALRQRLAMEGLPTDSAGKPGVYTKAIAGAVATFQIRHAIPVDSILGGATLASLNIPADYRLGQIAANLERYRWLPRALGSRYVLVNVPAFHLAAYDSGVATLQMKVIVGQDYEGKATPVFSDSMEFVVFRPYWDITDDIAAKETMPKIASDPNYMSANNLEYYTEGGKQHIRQRPGPKNSLGLVKFIFPNDYNIYLHDTPEDELFKKDVRAFSHGCIRLEKPAEMAQWVLGWPADKVNDAMQNGPDNHRVNLPKKIPVYIVYFTSYVADSTLYFGNDLYKRDDAIVKAVSGAAQPSADVVKAAATLRKDADEIGAGATGAAS